MKILIAVAPERFRDEELMVPVAAFQKAGIPYDIASTRRGPCSGMLGAKTTATLAFGEVDQNLYGAMVIIGGGGSQVHLWKDPLLRTLVQSFHASTKDRRCHMSFTRSTRPCRDPERDTGDFF